MNLHIWGLTISYECHLSFFTTLGLSAPLWLTSGLSSQASTLPLLHPPACPSSSTQFCLHSVHNHVNPKSPHPPDSNGICAIQCLSYWITELSFKFLSLTFYVFPLQSVQIASSNFWIHDASKKWKTGSMLFLFSPLFDPLLGVWPGFCGDPGVPRLFPGKAPCYIEHRSLLS